MTARIRRFVVALACAVPLVAVAPIEAAARPPIAPEPPQPPAFALASAHGPESGRARLGVQVSSMTPELRKFLGAKEEAGILVQRVESESAASRAGVKVGDIVVAVDGNAIGEIGEVAEALADRKKGDKVDVVVVRKKKRRTLRVELQEDASDRGFAVGDVQIHGMPGFSFGDGSKEIEALRAVIEKLESRLEALEKRDRSRRRSSAP
jgi:membrane-associated protease RseP (regulator of RpoE activity)